MTWDNIALLRLYVDDRQEGTEVFPDTELQNFLDASGGDVDLAASKVWLVKAASVHDWYFSSTDGAILSREQVFDHCMTMSKHFEGRSSGEIESVRMDSGGGGFSTTTSSEF